ncbi:hypothetical protein AACH06_27995 [Ideonella sp. DXS29W]|uniref:EthD domain-containing protein n=1 Tax=Ideonella lacteola TaxID=2984193 RepID=A0ABU9BXH0_9BURK
MSSQVLLITELTPKVGAIQRVAGAWAAMSAPERVAQRRVYEAVDGSSVLELSALNSLADVATLIDWWGSQWSALGEQMDSDFRRQVVTFIEAPKDTSSALPETPYVQLRHVEVPPANYGDYRAWRERTIFDVVRTAPQVEVFLAYHSVISTEPGVMFVSGFSAPVEEYTAVFHSPRYQQIVREAGNQFITGGDRGLYTKIYRHVAAR